MCGTALFRAVEKPARFRRRNVSGGTVTIDLKDDDLIFGRGVEDNQQGIVSSILAGLASTGMSSLLVLSLIGLVCGFLTLPFEAALVLFVAVEPVCDVLRTLVLVAGNELAALPRTTIVARA